jgi:NAD-dependent DNA ligase
MEAITGILFVTLIIFIIIHFSYRKKTQKQLEQLYNSYNQKEEQSLKVPRKKTTGTIYPERRIDSDVLVQDLETVSNKNTIFYNKKVVISGELKQFPLRNDLASLLKNYGADINTSISSKTDIFIVGSDYGPVKMEQVEKLLSDGHNIKIIKEKELYKLLQQYNSDI